MIFLKFFKWDETQKQEEIKFLISMYQAGEIHCNTWGKCKW